jgi:hypothetical protein
VGAAFTRSVDFLGDSRSRNRVLAGFIEELDLHGSHGRSNEISSPLLSCRFPKPHTWSATVLVDELGEDWVPFAKTALLVLTVSALADFEATLTQNCEAIPKKG